MCEGLASLARYLGCNKQTFFLNLLGKEFYFVYYSVYITKHLYISYLRDNGEGRLRPHSLSLPGYTTKMCMCINGKKIHIPSCIDILIIFIFNYYFISKYIMIFFSYR